MGKVKQTYTRKKRAVRVRSAASSSRSRVRRVRRKR